MAAIERVQNDWRRVRGLRRWESLATSGYTYEPVGKNIYRVGAETYLVVTSLSRDLRENEEGAPFIMNALWAPSVGAALRCAVHEIEADDQAVGRPPSDLMPNESDGSYESLRRLTSTRGNMEHAEYRVGPTGQGEFVQQILEIGDLGFCFRRNRLRKTDAPYAIRIALPVGPESIQ